MEYRTRNYQTDGNAALAVEEAPVFVLHDGKAAARQTKARPQAAGGSRVWTLLACTAIVLSFFGAWYAGDAIESARLRAAESAIATESYAVQDSDTLWSIASDHGAEGMTTQQTVQWIEEENGLSRASIQPGQMLTVPAAQH